MNKLTVFTPTFNRKHLLEKLFFSLKKQSNKNFEWIIVDDGSLDQTDLLVEELKEQADFEMRYFYQKNGGKHRAINKGLDLARGNLFFIVDSDDTLTTDAVEKIFTKYKSVEEDERFAGIAFNRGFSETKIVGETFNGTFIDCDNLHRAKKNILGDKAEIYRTEILKQIKFPEIPGENFMSEVVLWNEVARRGYQIRWFNEIIYICDYLEDGLTKNSNRILLENPIAHQMMTRELLEIDFSFKKKLGLIFKYYQIRNQNISKISRDLQYPFLVVSLAVLLGRLRAVRKRRENE